MSHSAKNVDVDRLRREHAGALDALRVIGRLSDDPRIVSLCKGAVKGVLDCEDTERLDAIERERADIELTHSGVWRVSCVEGEFVSTKLRRAIDGMRAKIDERHAQGVRDAGQ